MNKQDLLDFHKQFVMPTYAPSLLLTKGQGANVWDADGNKYLDFVGGVAVTSIGHCHPRLVKAIRQQAGKLMHVSNLFYNENQPRLARAIAKRSLGGKVFFCNSGAEANEGLIKLARKWGHEAGKYEIICCTNSFHGRTLHTLTATGQEKIKIGFDPLPEGFVHAEFNNLGSVQQLINERTVAILVEPVQGEGGVVPADSSFISGLRSLCRDHDLLLLMDEVQTGFGRTGHWFGFQHFDVQPDAISLAKGIGGGFPFGAIVANERVADVLQPGSHATTFGGSPLACAAGLAVIETIEEERLVEHAVKMGELLTKRLERLVRRHPICEAVRGQGLLQGLVLTIDAKPIEEAAREQGLLVLATAGNVIRMVPPLNVKPTQIKRAVKLLDHAIKSLAKQPVEQEEPETLEEIES